MSELQAVLLCGGSGSRMSELTGHVQKCLLPVAGVPMFWYPLNLLSQTGIKDVKLVTTEHFRSEYERLLADSFYQWKHMKVEVLCVPREHDDWGTADVIRHFHAKLTRDLLIISGDFVSDMHLYPMIDQFRCSDASLCMLLSENCVNGNIPGEKGKRSKFRDLIAWNETTKRVVFCCAEEDFDNAVQADVWISKFSNVSLTAKFNDCHVYLMKNSTLSLLQKHKKLSSLKADFIPYLLQAQYTNEDRGSGDGVGGACVAYVQPLENGTTVSHANNLGAYFEVNKMILKSLNRVSPRLGVERQFNFKETGISCAESRVADSASVSERVVIKRSVIGDKVIVGEKARIQGCVIMDGVEIGKGTNVTMSIVCPGAKLLDGAEVMNCIVTSNQTVPANAKVQNKVIDEGSDDEWMEE